MKAYRIDCLLDSGDKNIIDKKLIEMVYAYWDAFDMGIEEAGINLLRHLFQVKVNAKCDDDDRSALQDKYMALVEGLELVDNPAGEYYRAQSMILGIIENDMSEEQNFDDGIRLLYQLANNGNEYAMAAVETLEK